MYTKGEVVWAKIKGFPWWPGVVAKVIEERGTSQNSIEVLVNFIGENSHAQLSLEKVAKYQDKYSEFAKMKKKKLLESIEIANKIIRGETTFEDESDKLKLEYSRALAEVKPKPKPNNHQNPQRGRNSKSDDKSQSNENDSDLKQYESDQSSMHEMDIMSPIDKTKKKTKPIERKDSERKSSFTKSQDSSAQEKSPIVHKNIKPMNGKREADYENGEFEELKPNKTLKTDPFIDDASKTEPKRFEDLNGKLIRQASKNSVASNTTHTNSNSTNNNVMIIDTTTTIPNGILINTNISPQNNNSNGGLIRNRTKDFEALHELIIEKISNYGSPSVSGPILEKSIENVLSKINPEAVSISEILENDLGKNIYTLLVLLDELSNSVPKSGGNSESEFSGIKDRLINLIDIVKNKLNLQYIENIDHSSYWLNKLNERRSDGSETHNNAGKLNKNDSMMSQKMEEELQNGHSKMIEEETKERSTGISNLSKPINFEEYRYDKVVTTSTTKVSKPIYTNTSLDAAKLGEKQKEMIVNPNLRKKICLKMCKILQEKYLLEKEKAQKLTMRIENAIRQASPEMQSDYKDKVLIILKTLKFSLLDINDFGSDFRIDFEVLKDRLDLYQKQNGDLNLDGEDSPRLSKDMSRESTLLNGKMGEVK